MINPRLEKPGQLKMFQPISVKRLRNGWKKEISENDFEQEIHLFQNASLPFLLTATLVELLLIIFSPMY